MSSPYSSMDTIQAQSAPAHGLHTLVINPHVATAIWAIVLALACVIVVIVADMVKQRNEQDAKRRRHNPPS